MKTVTLCFLVDGEKILLGLKKRGFGEGKWNGFGGKVEEGETVPRAAVREIKEEAGVSVDEESLRKVGILDFHFFEKPDSDLSVHIFLTDRWQGEPIESEEMKPAWYEKDSLPYENMWVDDPLWLPRVLGGESVAGRIHLSSDGTVIRASEFSPVPPGSLL